MAVLCLFWPQALRDYAVRSSRSFNPFLGWMKSPSYVWFLRGWGVLTLCIVVLFGMIWIRGPN